MSESVIFQASDLAGKRRAVLEAARESCARVRDTDGIGLVMLREDRLQLLELVAEWARAHSRLQRLLAIEEKPSVATLGEQLAWLRVFDVGDLREFCDDLDDALVAARADDDPAPLRECLRAWRLTARQLEDPLRRSVLLGVHDPADYTDAERPSEVG